MLFKRSFIKHEFCMLYKITSNLWLFVCSSARVVININNLLFLNINIFQTYCFICTDLSLLILNFMKLWIDIKILILRTEMEKNHCSWCSAWRIFHLKIDAWNLYMLLLSGIQIIIIIITLTLHVYYYAGYYVMVKLVLWQEWNTEYCYPGNEF